MRLWPYGGYVSGVFVFLPVCGQRCVVVVAFESISVVVFFGCSCFKIWLPWYLYKNLAIKRCLSHLVVNPLWQPWGHIALRRRWWSFSWVRMIEARTWRHMKERKLNIFVRYILWILKCSKDWGAGHLNFGNLSKPAKGIYKLDIGIWLQALPLM